MSDTSAIEWTDATWNPVTGCSKVSQGCKNCYALREWPRLSAPRPQPNVYTGRAFTDVQCHPERLEQPLRWKKPRRIFVNSMSDLFHEAVPDAFIAAVFGIMLAARQHTFQVLTKRPERARPFLVDVPDIMSLTCAALDQAGIERGCGSAFDEGDSDWPLPNVWLGVSVEDQATADERIPLLLQTPAAVRFISAEPLLGPLDLAPKADATYQRLSEWYGPDGFDPTGSQPRRERRSGYFPKVDWVIAGGESGPKARPSHPDWFRSLRDQCLAAGVPFFFKQWGEWGPDWEGAMICDGCGANKFDAAVGPGQGEEQCGRCGGRMWKPTERPLDNMCRIGKRAAGRQLDGREWNEYPTQP